MFWCVINLLYGVRWPLSCRIESCYNGVRWHRVYIQTFDMNTSFSNTLALKCINLGTHRPCCYSEKILVWHVLLSLLKNSRVWTYVSKHPRLLYHNIEAQYCAAEKDVTNIIQKHINGRILTCQWSPQDGKPPVVFNLFRSKQKKRIHIVYYLWKHRWHVVVIFPCGRKAPLIPHSQYHGFWCPGDARRQDISSHVTDLIPPEYSSFSTRRINEVFTYMCGTPCLRRLLSLYLTGFEHYQDRTLLYTFRKEC